MPASHELTHLLVSQACLQANPAPDLPHPPWGTSQAFTPAARGEQLMAAVTALAQPSQHTQGPATLLKVLINAYGLVAAAQSAIEKVSFCGACRCDWGAHGDQCDCGLYLV